MNTRQKILLGSLALGFGAVLTRTLQLQLFPGSRLNALMERNLSRDITLVGRRGTLKDRLGSELAVSVDSLSIFVDPRMLPQKKRGALIEKLAKVTDLTPAQVAEKISANQKRRFVWIRRQLDNKAMRLWQESKLASVPGVGALPEFRRVYPFGSLAAQVLGFVSVDGRGLESAERGFDGKLGGERLQLRVPTDARGRPVFKQEEQVQFREMAGQDITLSLDHRIQFSAERALRTALKKHEAAGGTVVVMNPHSGELLAMVSLPAFDPNEVGASETGARRNRVVSDWFEPGSIMKPIAVLEGLDRGLFSPKTKVDGGGGKVKIGRKVITEADTKHYFDSLSVFDVIRFSSNVGMVSLLQRHGFDFIQSSLEKTGFGKKTGIDLPGESGGLFRTPKRKQMLEKATISYGHGIAVTPIQVATAYAIIANGGHPVRPTILKRVTDEVSPGKPIFSRQAITQIRSMLSAVVNDGGTGTAAALGTVAIAGKTGTAWKVDTEVGGYKAGAYVSSFAGYFPAEAPRYVIAVSVDEPRKNGYYGGAVTGPIVKDLAFEILRFSEALDSPIVNASLPAVR